MKNKLNEFEKRFNIYNWKTFGLIFIFTVFVIPTLSSLILYIFNKIENNLSSFANVSWMQIIQISVESTSILVGFLVIYYLQDPANNIIKTKKMWIAYLFYEIKVILIFLMVPATLVDERHQSLPTITINATAELLILIYALKNFGEVIQGIKDTFKQKKYMVVLYVLLGAALVFLLNLIIHKIIIKQPDNQNTLISGFIKGETIYNIFYLITLFCFTILIAPLVEELFCRYLFSYYCSNRWLTIIFSCMFFAFMHTNSTGDFESALIYFAPSLVLTLMFVLNQGQITYCWFVHTITNSIAIMFVIKDIQW